ncbi:baseplate assembly protein [Geomonas limicola]|uniref:Baseplate assembly protein n=1 Tax=Geomonas limicola TaxID=2740186 RepID=A0A6V8N5N4_9BACT|nr:phage baseplate assembly protein [Geomonas limicola]GFO67875.1 baseplate assembly protein [Geomonas limicola]
MIRGIVKSVMQGVIQRVSASVWGDGAIDNRELFQHYGFTSRPLAGSEVIFIRQGNHFIAIASDDRRYRIGLEEGELAIYDDQGQKVHLKREGIIEVVATEKLIASCKEAEIFASTSATITTPQLTVVASTKVTMDTPLLELTGDLTVAGAAQVAGALSSATSVADPNGTMQEMRGVFNEHDHVEHGTGGGMTDPPNQEM